MPLLLPLDWDTDDIVVAGEVFVAGEVVAGEVVAGEVVDAGDVVGVGLAVELDACFMLVISDLSY